MEYAGFWQRFGSYWLDLICLLPIIAISFWGSEQFRLFQLYWFIPGLLIEIWFYVYLVKRYGGTPGKLILKIKITKVDGSDVGYKEAILRHIVSFAITLAIAVATIPVLLGMTDMEYFSMDLQARGVYITENTANWYRLLHILLNIWIWSEFIVILANKKRRAIHDFMAGTVVVRKESLGYSKHI